MPLRHDAVIMPLRHDVACPFGVACDPAICARCRSRLMTSHRHQDWAHPYYLRREWAHPPVDVMSFAASGRHALLLVGLGGRLHAGGSGLAPPTSAPGLGSPLPHLHRDWAHPCHICAGTGLTPAHICAGIGPTLAHIRAGTRRESARSECGRTVAHGRPVLAGRFRARARPHARRPHATLGLPGRELRACTTSIAHALSIRPVQGRCART
jgi:hypothetical protein